MIKFVEAKTNENFNIKLTFQKVEGLVNYSYITFWYLKEFKIYLIFQSINSK
jgi:hypothetical protein